MFPRKASLRTQHVLGDDRVHRIFEFFNSLGPVNGKIRAEKCTEVLGSLGTSCDLPIEHIIMSRRALDQSAVESDRDSVCEEEEFDGWVRGLEFVHFFVHVASVFSIDEVDERMAQLGLRQVTATETNDQQSQHERRRSRRRQSSKTSKAISTRALGEGRIGALGKMFDALPQNCDGAVCLETCENRLGTTFRQVLDVRRSMIAAELNTRESNLVTRTEWVNYFVQLSLVKDVGVIDRFIAGHNLTSDERSSRHSELISERAPADAPAIVAVPDEKFHIEPSKDAAGEHSFTASFSSYNSSEAPQLSSEAQEAPTTAPPPRRRTAFCIVL